MFNSLVFLDYVMLAEVLALLAALFFGLNLVTTRRGLVSGHVYVGVLISIVMGVPMYFLISLITQEFLNARLTLSAVLILVLAGILNFGVGRNLLYRSVQLVGANISGPIISSSALYSVVLGVTLLGEEPTMNDLLGIVLILVGLTLITMRGVKVIKSYRGLIYAFISSVILAVTPVLVKVGTVMLNAPILAITISYIAILPPYIAVLASRRFRDYISGIDNESLKYLTLAAITVNIAQLLRYVSLSMGDVSSVVPIMSTYILFGILLSYAINRNLEDFNIRIIAGATLVVLGTTLITL